MARWFSIALFSLSIPFPLTISVRENSNRYRLHTDKFIMGDEPDMPVDMFIHDVRLLPLLHRHVILPEDRCLH